MKNKLTLLTSIILAFALVVVSPANAKDQDQGNKHYQQKKSKQFTRNKVTHKKVVHIVQQRKSAHQVKHHQKIKPRVQYKLPTTFIKIASIHNSMFTILLSQNNFNKHANDGYKQQKISSNKGRIVVHP